MTRSGHKEGARHPNAVRTAFLLLIGFVSTTDYAQSDKLPSESATPPNLRVLSFNILQGGGNAANVGFANDRFGGSRYDEIAGVIRQTKADVVGVQEDDKSGRLLAELGDEWNRVGAIYSKLPLQLVQDAKWLTVARVATANGSVVVVNCHWRPSDYGPFLVQDYIRENGVPTDAATFAQNILKASDRTGGDRGYQRTLDAVRPWIAAGETVVVTGDFNEPSHLDWTDAAADRGMDRWVKNPTTTPLRFPIPWKGSRLMAKLGLHDTYRIAFPDETKQPGNTWTPPYADGTPGRRPYADQVLDRIDMIYVHGSRLKVRSAAVIGESRQTSEILFDGRWPSDHRAVLAVFDLK
ncbi:MAG: endonuclease/exonuclease/phosphatase family protein [Fuerstiella sp.]|nr:endonuclease/exonuclease/phosphatase family protein [Fuerstiella sp.]